MIQTVIVEDSPIVQSYLSEMLAKDPGYRVTAIYADAFEAEAACASGGVDLVLMDILTLHNHSGLAAGERIRKSAGAPKVVIVTSLVDPEVLTRAKAGAADSLWYKDHSPAELMDVIRRTLAGEHIFPDSAPNIELGSMFSGEIPPKQLAVLRCFVKGMTLEETAEALSLSRNGVRWHLAQLMEKGGFQNKYELFAAVVSSKLIVTNLMDETER